MAKKQTKSKLAKSLLKQHAVVSTDDPITTGRNVYWPAGLFYSQAYCSLKTAACYIVYGILRSKCQWEYINTGSRDKIMLAGKWYKRNSKRAKELKRQGYREESQWIIKNNGKIMFTYDEAKEKCDISPGRFGRAIDELLDKGLIDIVPKKGDKEPNKYFISNRWQAYGTDKFKKLTRPKSPNNKGSQKGNKYGRNCSPNQKDDYHKRVANEKMPDKAAEVAELTTVMVACHREVSKVENEIQELIKLLESPNSKYRIEIHTKLQLAERHKLIAKELAASCGKKLQRIRDW